MVELIVVACLLASPDECREHRLRLTLDGMDPGQCMYSSPPRIALWQEMHKAWKVKSWKCSVILNDRQV